MKYRLVFRDRVLQDLAELPASVRQRIFQKLETLTDDPRPASATALTGDLRGYWRLRIGQYRASYTVEDETQEVRVWNAGHRNRFYDRMRRKTKK